MIAPVEKPKNIPTVFIIFGATGDLMSKKIVPALYHLRTKNKLPRLLRIIGFSRRNLSQEQFIDHIESILNAHFKNIQKSDVESFLKLFMYHQGNFEHIDDYKRLAAILGNIDGVWNVCSNKLFYLAVPPQYYKTMFEHLSVSGLTTPCSPEEGWTRVLVEKPFGKDLATAEELDLLLGKLFREEQIYRIDHYLAKDALQNILSFRFSNNLFEDVWNNKYVEKIEVRLLEDVGVEARGEFYDGIGALRDVGQNHLLQMLSLITMDQPKDFSADEVRKKRLEVFKSLKIPDLDDVKYYTFRAQYDGYRKINGVTLSSQTETYFKVLGSLTTSRWSETPFILESGKNTIRKKEIIITFKHPTPCLCPSDNHYKNKVIFYIEPKEEIAIEFWAKKPGLDFEMEKQNLSFLYRDARKKAQYIEEYEKLLLDCISGNQLLFTSTSEVRAMWAFIDPILSGWHANVVPLHFYKPKSREILRKSPIVERLEAVSTKLKTEIGIIGLGKMGGGIARRLVDKGWRVVGYNRSEEDTKRFESEGGDGAYSLDDLVQKIKKPRVILLSLPAGKPTSDMIDSILSKLGHGDYIIDAANGFYKDTIENYKKMKARGIRFVDVGISGGPSGARNGSCLMVGGKKEVFERLEPLFVDMAVEGGVQFFEGEGAGHFVKMVHNGIEYGMMQAIAEGFTILKESSYKLDLTEVADVYNHGSVIESRLINWLKEGFELYGEELAEVSGTVAHTGEGEWMVKTAEELDVKTKVIEEALKFRIESEKNPSYTGKILSALRSMFGGHSVEVER